jgi:hypothetical protein
VHRHWPALFFINETPNLNVADLPYDHGLKARDPTIKARVIDSISKLAQLEEVREGQLQLNGHASSILITVNMKSKLK